MSQTENFVDRPGSDYHNYHSGDFGRCAKSCATDSRCEAYTYVLSTGICWMKDRVPSQQQNNCCISGVKVMSTQQIDIDMPGSDIMPGFSVRSAARCETLCRDNAQCQSYTYVKPGIQAESGMCWLKHGIPGRVRNDCCISGAKRQR